MRRVLYGLLGLVLALIALITVYLPQVARVGSGYAGKLACSGLYVSGLSWEDIRQNELAPYGYIDISRDDNKKRITASLLGTGLGQTSVVFREGLGCTIVRDQEEDLVLGQPYRFQPAIPDKRPWPAGDLVVLPDVARLPAGLQQAVEKQFSINNKEQPQAVRAVLVVQNDRIISEKYVAGVSPENRLHGWSMSKSVTSALIGIAESERLLNRAESNLFSEWQYDERRRITIDSLLHMDSGLQFNEDYDNPLADAPVMLFDSRSTAAYARAKPAAYAPDTVHYYSSGTTNLLMDLLKTRTGGRLETIYTFTSEKLFRRIGMNSTIFEPDTSGTPVGSSFVYATARDWARLGLLFLKKGRWNGQVVLPEAYVNYALTATPRNLQGEYGAHIWLNRPDKNGKRVYPSLPEDMFCFRGFQGQVVAVFPDKNAVVVRLGITRKAEAFNREEFLASVYNSL